MLEERDMTIRKHESMRTEHLKRMAELDAQISVLQGDNEAFRTRLAISSRDSEGDLRRSQTSAEIMAVLQKDANMNGQMPTVLFQKKMGVSAESREDDIYKTDKIKLVHHKKSHDAQELIRTSVLNNDFLKHLDSEQVSQIVDCMYDRTVAATAYIIREGEPGAHLYVAQDGELEVSENGDTLGTMGPGKIFGELCSYSLQLHAYRQCERSVYQLITMRLGVQRHDTWTDFLSKVHLFKSLQNSDIISRIADALEEDYYGEGTYIVREGEKGNRFFLIKSGKVKVTQLIEGEDEPQEIRIMTVGDYFGEKALDGDEIRTASVIAMSPGVAVLALDRDHYRKLVGDLVQLKSMDYGDEQRGAKRPGGSSCTLRGFSSTSSLPASRLNRDHIFADKKAITNIVHCERCKYLDRERGIGFARRYYKCDNCAMALCFKCHPNALLPCVPKSSTRRKGQKGDLVDFVDRLSRPQVPHILIHLINEIERRGVGVVDDYQRSGCESDVKRILSEFCGGSLIQML